MRDKEPKVGLPSISFSSSAGVHTPALCVSPYICAIDLLQQSQVVLLRLLLLFSLRAVLAFNMDEGGDAHNGILTRRRSAQTLEELSRVSRRSSSSYIAAKSSLPSVLIGFSTSTVHQNFQPVSDEIPPALLPVRQVPLLLYSIDFLIRNGRSRDRFRASSAASVASLSSPCIKYLLAST